MSTIYEAWRLFFCTFCRSWLRMKKYCPKLSLGIYTFQLHILLFAYIKLFAILLFWVLWVCLAVYTLSDIVNLLKTFIIICRQKMNFIPLVFLEMLRRFSNFLLWVFWAYLAMQTQNSINLIVSICRKLRCLSSYQNYISFLRYWMFNNPAIWLANNIMAHNSRTRILPDIGLVMKYQ